MIQETRVYLDLHVSYEEEEDACHVSYETRDTSVPGLANRRCIAAQASTLQTGQPLQ